MTSRNPQRATERLGALRVGKGMGMGGQAVREALRGFKRRFPCSAGWQLRELCQTGHYYPEQVKAGFWGQNGHFRYVRNISIYGDILSFLTTSDNKSGFNLHIRQIGHKVLVGPAGQIRHPRILGKNKTDILDKTDLWDLIDKTDKTDLTDKSDLWG
jgi:hypothetical protein